MVIGKSSSSGRTASSRAREFPREAPAVRRALTLGVPVIGELELAWRLLPNRFVAVTGTNGKTTVAELLGHVWRAAGEPVAVAGNVGTPLASLVGDLDADATVICEASSFQLEDSTDFAPECALLLNATPDHLDRHRSFDEYLGAKLRIFACQRAGRHRDRRPLGPGDRRPRAPRRGARGRRRQPRSFRSSRPGRLDRRRAQRANARFAAAAGARDGPRPRRRPRRGITSFPGVPHRLERVAEVGGVAYVNDSKATNVAAASAALRSFDGGVHVILGGSLKGEDFAGLAEPVAERAVAAYLTGPAADPIAAALGADGRAASSVATACEQAFAAAAAAAEPGQTVLLAPACASFDAYRDYEARGDHFRRLVQGLRP